MLRPSLPGRPDYFTHSLLPYLPWHLGTPTPFRYHFIP